MISQITPSRVFLHKGADRVVCSFEGREEAVLIVQAAAAAAAAGVPPLLEAVGGTIHQR